MGLTIIKVLMDLGLGIAWELGQLNFKNDDLTITSNGNLPWFIWREIIDYTISSDIENLLTRNKDWFKYGATRLLIYGEKMTFYEKNTIDLEKLNNVLKLVEYPTKNQIIPEFYGSDSSATLYLTEDTSYSKNYSITLLEKNTLESVHLIDIKKAKNRLHYVLNTYSAKIEILRINSIVKGLDFNIINKPFANLTTLEVKSLTGTIVFSDITRNMPSLEYLKIDTKNIIFQLFSNEISHFQKLKTLVLNQRGFLDNIYKINGIFHFHFPELKIFTLYLKKMYLDLENISTSMPNIQFLDHTLDFFDNIGSPFPHYQLLYLQKLHTYKEHRKKGYTIFHIDIKHVPRLRWLKINQNFVLMDSETANYTSIQEKRFEVEYKLSCNGISYQLPVIQKFTLDCAYLRNNITAIYTLFNKVVDLSLDNVGENIIRYYFPQGPFKTEKLKLSGHNYLNIRPLYWLSHHSQLAHLTLELTSYAKFISSPILFRNLRVLNIICPNQDYKLYLRSIITYDSSFKL